MAADAFYSFLPDSGSRAQLHFWEWILLLGYTFATHSNKSRSEARKIKCNSHPTVKSCSGEMHFHPLKIRQNQISYKIYPILPHNQQHDIDFFRLMIYLMRGKKRFTCTPLSPVLLVIPPEQSFKAAEITVGYVLFEGSHTLHQKACRKSSRAWNQFLRTFIWVSFSIDSANTTSFLFFFFKSKALLV